MDRDAKAPRIWGAFCVFHSLGACCALAIPSSERLRDAEVDLRSMSFSEVRLRV